MAKRYTETEKIENRLCSELGNIIDEFSGGSLTEEGILAYFSTMLRDAHVDSRIVVNVLEKPKFGKEGRDAAMAIKVNEGW